MINQGPTLTIIRTVDKGYLFGGYASASWASSKTYIRNANSSFLFTLINPYEIPPTKYSVSVPVYALFSHKNNCATFGGGHDICICSGSDKNTNSTIRFPHSYVDTTGRRELTFTGQTNFQTNEIEIYRLIST